MKPLLVGAVIILGILVVPPLLFLAVLGTAPGGGHPPPIIIPYLYVLFGFRFVGPVGAAMALAAARLAFRRGAPFRYRHGALALGVCLGLACAAAWLHRFA